MKLMRYQKTNTLSIARTFNLDLIKVKSCLNVPKALTSKKTAGTNDFRDVV